MLAGLLYERMRELGIQTEAELAARTGLSPSQVSRLLSGRIRDVPSLTLVALSEHLQLDPGLIAYAAAGLPYRDHRHHTHPGIAALLERYREGEVQLSGCEVSALLRYEGCLCRTARAALGMVYMWRVWRSGPTVGEE